MKHLLFLLFILLASQISSAQWTLSGSHVYNSNSGNVGVGTSTPAYKFDVSGDFRNSGVIWNTRGTSEWALYGSNADFIIETTGSGYLRTKTSLMVDGNLGLGTMSPQNIMHLNGASDGLGYLRITDGLTGSGSTDGVRIGFNSGALRIQNYENSPISFFTNSSTEALTIAPSGYIGIGTSIPDSKLTVAGKIHSQEVKVTTTAGADFVFEDDYKLRSLAETETFIKENKHLPEIASAKDMVKNGIDLGEMNVKLLQKIEELTLHLIEQNKTLNEQARENKEQGSKIKDLEKEIQKITYKH